MQPFLANPAIAVVPIWASLLAHLLPFFRAQRLTFVPDTTPLDTRACVVYRGLVVHSRLLPVGGPLMPLSPPWEEHQWAIVGTLLDRVAPPVGAADCTLIADSGLVGLPLVQLCRARQWHSLLRLSAPHICRAACGQRAGRERAAPWARMTARLTQALFALGRATCGKPGARLAARLVLPTFWKTILRRIMAVPPPPIGPGTRN